MKFSVLAGDSIPFTYSGSNLPAARATVERAMVFAALNETRGNKLQAAKLIGVSRGTFDKIYKTLSLRDQNRTGHKGWVSGKLNKEKKENG